MKKLKEAEKPDSIEQSLYNLAINPMLLRDNKEVAKLMIEYSRTIKILIKDNIETHKDRIGYEPFNITASFNSIFCDDTDKNDIKYFILQLNIYYANLPHCKYVVEIPSIKPISLDEFLDHYNDGLKSGMIPKGSK